MLKNFFQILAILVIAGFITTGCGSRKYAAQNGGYGNQNPNRGSYNAPNNNNYNAPSNQNQNTAQPVDDEVAKLEREAKIIEAQAKVDAARIKAEQARRHAEQLAAQNATLDEGTSIRLVPCEEKGFDKAGEYYAGFGVGESLNDEDMARKEARNAAMADLEGKFVGTIENILTDYNSKTHTPSDQLAREGNLENGLRSATKKVLNSYFNVVCSRSTRTKFGTIKWYVAGQIPIGTYKQNVAKELDVLKVKYNRDKLFEAMDNQLNKQAEEERQKREEVINQQQNSENK